MAAADALGAVHASVSGWLAEVLFREGVDATPDAMRARGGQAAADPGALVDAVLAHYRWDRTRPLLFDAVRHLDVLVALRDRAHPWPVLHVALVLDPSALARRLAARGDAEAVSAAAGHSTERQVPELVAAAELVLDAAAPLPQQLAVLRRAVQALR